MDRDELYDFLDIEHGSQFEYFENFADLAEYDGEIENDVIYDLFQEINLKTFAELCDSYFYDTLEHVPGDQIDLYNLLENIKRSLIGLSEAAWGEEHDNALINLADQFNRFRCWYSNEPLAECRNMVSGQTNLVTVRDALTTSRLEKLSTDEFIYDFTRALDYPIEEYIMTFADLVE